MSLPFLEYCLNSKSGFLIHKNDSATCCLTVLNISVKFHEITWNGFKVTEWIHVYDQKHY